MLNATIANNGGVAPAPAYVRVKENLEDQILLLKLEINTSYAFESAAIPRSQEETD